MARGRPRTQVGECDEPGCARPKASKGLCGTHRKAAWIRSNPKRYAEYQHEYQARYAGTKRGAEVRRARNHNYRAAKLGAFSGCWFAREEFVDLISQDPCAYCGQELPVEIDHIDPLSISANDSWSNLAPACRSCNASKGAKDLLTFLSNHKK